jgi:hypothetical protein
LGRGIGEVKGEAGLKTRLYDRRSGSTRYTPFGEYFVRMEVNGFAAAGAATFPLRISSDPSGFP